MKEKSLEIPNDLIFDQNLTDSQRIILSALSTKPKQHAIDISKRIGKKIKTVRQELEELSKLNYVITSNGSNRLSYTTAKGFGFIGSTPEVKSISTLVEITLDKEKERKKERKEKEKERSKEKEKEKKEIKERKRKPLSFKKKKKEVYHPWGKDEKSIKKFDKLFVLTIEDQVSLALEYWIQRGGIKHREGTKVYNEGIKYLTKLFYGTMFKNIPDDLIDNPLLAKKAKFTLEDWKTSIDNMHVALNSPAHLPVNKTRFKNFVKNLKLREFIYHPFAKEGLKRSTFLKYLDPPKRFSKAVKRYKTLTTLMERRLVDLRIEDMDIIIEASNKYGDLMKKYKEDPIYDYWKESVAEIADIYMEFIERKINLGNFKPHWLIAPWFVDKLETYLVDVGLIRS